MLINNLKLCSCISTKFFTSPAYLNIRKSDLLLRKVIQHPSTQRNFTKIATRNNRQKIFLHVKQLIKNGKRYQETVAQSNNVAVKELTQKKVKFTRSDVVRLFSLAKDEKLVLCAAIGCLLVSSVITMSVPYALGRILDIIFNKTDTITNTKETLTNFCALLCGIFVIGGLANFGRVYLFNSASLRIVRDLRARLYSRMLNQESSWFDTKGTGELVSRLATDTYLVGNSLSQNLSDGLRSTIMILAGTTMMIYTSPKLAIISVAIVPCIAGVAVIYGKYLRNITRNLLDKFADISKSAEERLGNIKTVKVFGTEDLESKNYQYLLVDALKLGYKEVLAKSTFYGITGLSGNIIIVSVLYYGGTLVVTDELTVGALTSFIFYAAYSAISLNGISNFYTELNKGIGSAQRLWDIIDRKYEIPTNIGIIPKVEPLGKIEFQNVYFSFPSRQNNEILSNFNLILNPGQTTAIVGRSGSGKSTIGSLLLRLYDPINGIIKLDNANLKDINPLWLRSHIGAVNQEPVLFSGTIKDNIMYGLNPGITISEQKFKDVIKKAHVDEFASSLPDGLNTLVGQRGMMLSGGQKQRVAIARALIRNPTILLLDEATSALDSVSEELVQNALEKLAKGRTVLTIAHRLSTVSNADKIVVLDKGRICEEGPYHDLIAKENGIFKYLVKKQAFLDYD